MKTSFPGFDLLGLLALDVDPPHRSMFERMKQIHPKGVIARLK
jgi:hypothetical protein